MWTILTEEWILLHVHRGESSLSLTHILKNVYFIPIERKPLNYWYFYQWNDLCKTICFLGWRSKVSSLQLYHHGYETRLVLNASWTFNSPPWRTTNHCWNTLHHGIICWSVENSVTFYVMSSTDCKLAAAWIVILY